MPRTRQRVTAWMISAAVCLLLAIATVVQVAPASAQTLVYDVGVDFPDYVVLWYWDQITFDLTTAELTNYIVGKEPANVGHQSATVGLAGSTLGVDADIRSATGNPLTGGPRLWLTVPDAWAMRSVSASGDTQVSISIIERDATIAGPGNNRIRVQRARVAAAGREGTNIVVPSTGASGHIWGEILLRVNINRAKVSGTYSGIVVQLTAENI